MIGDDDQAFGFPAGSRPHHVGVGRIGLSQVAHAEAGGGVGWVHAGTIGCIGPSADT